MRRRSLLSSIFIAVFPFVLLTSLVSCVSVRLDKKTVLQDIDRLRKPDYPSFTGLGSIDLKGGGTDYSGSITLALSGEKYRLEIFNAVGKTVMAVAGAPGRMIRIDPETGSKTVLTGKSANIVRLDGLSIPVSVLRSMVTGAPPTFGRVVSAYSEDGVKKALVAKPGMTLEYTDKLKKIIFEGDDSEEIIVTLSPFAKGGGTPYVSSVTIEFPERGAIARIKWNRVLHGGAFSKGYFSFDNTLDDLF